MAKKRTTYKQQYQKELQKLQRELNKPYYSGYSQQTLTTPKNVGKKQVERIQAITKEVKKIGERAKRLETRGYDFWKTPVQLPTRLTTRSAKSAQEKYKTRELLRSAQYWIASEGETGNPYLTGFEARQLERTLAAKRAAETRKENQRKRRLEKPSFNWEEYFNNQEQSEDDYRSSFTDTEWDFLQKYHHAPSTEELNDYEEEIRKAEEENFRAMHYIDEETGEFIPRSQVEREQFFKDNEFDVEEGTKNIPLAIDGDIKALNDLMNIVNSFDPNNIETGNPETRARKIDAVNSIKDAIENLLETTDKRDLAKNIENNWSDIYKTVDDIMYKADSGGVSAGYQYDEDMDLAYLWEMLNE